MFEVNHIGKWTLAIPCHKPKKPRYCNRCHKRVASAYARKTLCLRVEAKLEPCIRQEGGMFFQDRVETPAVPELVIGFLVTACIECRLFFIDEATKKHPESRGLYELIRDHWRMKVEYVEEYETEARPQSENLQTVWGDIEIPTATAQVSGTNDPGS